MICYKCQSVLGEGDHCQVCGEYVGLYKKVVSLSNVYYNDGLEKASVRNLSGAVISLQQSIMLYKNNIAARNLLGLVYYEMGEVVAALTQWVISKNLETENNPADEFMNELRMSPTRLDALSQNMKKYNVALKYCRDGSLDVAVIQLKKVLSSNPRFLAAHQLLALLYMNSGSYSKAEKELNKALAIDNGNTLTRRYLAETSKMLSPGSVDDSLAPAPDRQEDVREYVSGNETIIEPVASRQRGTGVSILGISIGILLGLFTALFLILPQRIEKINLEANKKIAEFSEEAGSRSAQLLDKDHEIEGLNADIEKLQAEIDSYEGTDETVESMSQLLAAGRAYITDPADFENIGAHLDKVNVSEEESDSPDEQTAFYRALLEVCGVGLGDYYYRSGYEALENQEYDKAIADLARSVKYDSTNTAALYFLGSSYYESGELDEARKIYDQVMNEFPDTRYANNAETRIAEINNLGD
ncbi:tetratricopeptide repeat protein [Butyrivibrio sp. MC2013]|uniref:tetratricopeptide repeat protein n=1 Tax=Butyrivibrio sp. MC2013 TaxID=1280686 RepID=UPI00041C38C7|nr:tetratricopeptide repeat protein [Butyrivibrio sp. MC2013]